MVAHNKVIVQGSFAGGEEVWSFGIAYMGSTGAPTGLVTAQDDLNGWAADIRANIDTDLTLLRNCLTQNGGVGGVTTQFYGDANTLVRQSVVAGGYTAGLGTSYGPLQNAIVVSLQTGIPGASYRGRIYWPAPGAGIDASFRLDTPTDPADIASQMADWLNAVTGYALDNNGDVIPGVFSKVKNQVTPVTSIRVGNVCDTQRRRRDSLLETYSSVEL